MGKYKAAKKKSDTPTPPQIRPGTPCLVIVVGAMIVIILVMILAMRGNA